MKELTEVEKYFKEWASICRLYVTKEPRIYTHSQLLEFAEDYLQHKIKYENKSKI